MVSIVYLWLCTVNSKQCVSVMQGTTLFVILKVAMCVVDATHLCSKCYVCALTL